MTPRPSADSDDLNRGGRVHGSPAAEVAPLICRPALDRQESERPGRWPERVCRVVLIGEALRRVAVFGQSPNDAQSS